MARGQHGFGSDQSIIQVNSQCLKPIFQYNNHQERESLRTITSKQTTFALVRKTCTSCRFCRFQKSSFSQVRDLSCGHSFCTEVLKEHVYKYLGNKLIYSAYDPEGELQLKCPDPDCCNNILSELENIVGERLYEEACEASRDRFAELLVSYHPYELPPPEPAPSCMLCQDESMVFILHGTHTYCRRCLNGWAALEARSSKLSESEFKERVQQGAQKCPFMTCAETLNSKIVKQISFLDYQNNVL